MFEKLPQDVPGYARLEARRTELEKLLGEPALRAAVATKGIEPRLAELGVRREGAGPAGLGFIRRAQDDGYDYFLTNLGAQAFDGWLDLGVPAASAALLDPMNYAEGLTAIRPGANGSARVYLQLASGQSLVLTYVNDAAVGRDDSLAATSLPLVRQRCCPVSGRSSSSAGGRACRAGANMTALRSWTELEDPEATRFAGTARYRIDLRCAARARGCLAAGPGRCTRSRARAPQRQAPGRCLGTPFTLRIDAPLKRRGNVLEIAVSNLPANRIRDLDARKVDWKIMKDANLVTLQYTKFDASGWDAAPSGLLGPVRLVPLKVVSPR